jgi:hypothetical protein
MRWETLKIRSEYFSGQGSLSYHGQEILVDCTCVNVRSSILRYSLWLTDDTLALFKNKWKNVDMWKSDYYTHFED